MCSIFIHLYITNGPRFVWTCFNAIYVVVGTESVSIAAYISRRMERPTTIKNHLQLTLSLHQQELG